MSTTSSFSPSGEDRNALKIRVYGVRLTAWAHRFIDKVDASAGPDGCWPWIGARKPRGYGLFRVEPKPAAPRTASRLAFFLATGGEPKVVRHTCDWPPCCNPAHLVDGRQAHNILDGVLRGRIHPRWTPDPTKIDPSLPLTAATTRRVKQQAARHLEPAR